MRRLFEDVIGRTELLDEYGKYDYAAALISIWSPGDYSKFQKKPELIERYNKVINFYETSIRQDFWDTEDNVPGYDTISEDQACELMNFIVDNRDRTFIIHCDAGQSRSAGIALAVECIIGHGGDRHQAALSSSFTDNDRYTPNRRVYDKIMDAWDRKTKEVKDE